MRDTGTHADTCTRQAPCMLYTCDTRGAAQVGQTSARAEAQFGSQGRTAAATAPGCLASHSPVPGLDCIHSPAPHTRPCMCVLCPAVPAGTLSAQVRHPVWGEYAASLLEQGACRPKVRQGVAVLVVFGGCCLEKQLQPQHSAAWWVLQWQGLRCALWVAADFACGFVSP